MSQDEWELLPASEKTEWLALSIVEGWGEEKMRQAELLASLHNLQLQIAALRGVQIKKQDFREPEDYLPAQPRPAVSTAGLPRF